MRFDEIHLLRYGHFTDGRLPLPARRPDLHVIHGPNEGGKTTTKTALEDFLFDFPQTTPYNFLHAYADMRVAARLSRDGETLEARRRKGRDDTLLAHGEAGEAPAPEAQRRLSRWLAGIGREEFRRLFCLDADQLVAGGLDLLDSSGDAGAALFGAGTGLARPHAVLRELEAAADALWKPRGKTLPWNEAERRRREAVESRREHEVSLTRWRELRDEVERSRAEEERLRERSLVTRRELGHLRRVEGVRPHLAERRELLEELTAVADAPALPDDALRRLTQARALLHSAGGEIERIAEETREPRAALEALRVDETLLTARDELRALDRRRIELAAGRRQLPALRDRLREARKTLTRHGISFGWGGDDFADAPEARLPDPPRVDAAAEVWGERSGRRAELDGAARELDAAERAVRRAEDAAAELGEAPDVAPLEAALADAAEAPDEDRLEERREAAARIERAARAALARLDPAVVDDGRLLTWRPPERSVLVEHRQQRLDAERKLRELAEDEDTVRRQLAETHGQRRRLGEQGVSEDQLRQARRERDDAWSAFRQQTSGDTLAPEDPSGQPLGVDDLALDYEQRVTTADDLADRRFEHAEASAQIRMLDEESARLTERLEGLVPRRALLETHRADLDAAWRALWPGAPFPQDDLKEPDAMLGWAEEAEEARRLRVEADEATAAVAALEGRRAAARDRLLERWTHLAPNGTAPEAPPTTLTETVALTRAVVADRKALRQRIEAAEARIRAARDEHGTRSETHRRALAAWTDWEARWSARLDDLGLPEAAAALDGDRLFRLLDTARRDLETLRDLETEIAEIEAALEDQTRRVAELARRVAPDLASADDTLPALLSRADDAEAARARRDDLRGALEKLDAHRDREREKARDARAVLDVLADQAGVASHDDLDTAIERWQRRRRLEDGLARVETALRELGGELSVEQLEAEAAAVPSADELRARIEELEGEDRETEEERRDARGRLQQATRNLDAVGGGDRAARAEAEVQEASAEMVEVAEAYVLRRTAAVLLQAAMDRFREDHQGPILKRASALFAELTLGSLERLEVVYAGDRQELTALRPGGERVRVEGLSRGTEVQLYLALRVAALEHHLETAPPLPFLADDLFVDFDDRRAAAGFRVLHDLARRTQVLFFTHHPHLVELARATLDGDLHVTPLPPRALAS